MSDNIFDPFRFERTEIQSSADQAMLDRLAARIDEFKDLATIKDWDSVHKDREICLRLQQAHDIMHGYYYPPEFLKQHRCCPCEMEGLCAIKHIVNGDKFNAEFGRQVLQYLDIQLESPEKIKENIETDYPDHGIELL